jgi:hypothetical protein
LILIWDEMINRLIRLIFHSPFIFRKKGTTTIFGYQSQSPLDKISSKHKEDKISSNLKTDTISSGQNLLRPKSPPSIMRTKSPPVLRQTKPSQLFYCLPSIV